MFRYTKWRVPTINKPAFRRRYRKIEPFWSFIPYGNIANRIIKNLMYEQELALRWSDTRQYNQKIRSRYSGRRYRYWVR